MSRIGKLPIEIPSGVTASVDGREVKIKGPKGELSLTLVEDVTAKLEDGAVTITPRDQSKKARSMWGLQRTLVANMVEGVTNGFEKNLELQGVGYRAQLQGKALKLQLGLSHDVVYDPPEGITIAAPKPTEVIVSGIDKQKVGQTAAEIRKFRPPEPYKGKGIRYAGEYVRRKEGKKK
ncbi:MAG: 50S ribosomal protein L6 [Maricaulaceae bacterium]|jgi:large subunit ribosomal protein L6